MTIFIVQGLFAGILGTVLGAVLGLGIAGSITDVGYEQLINSNPEERTFISYRIFKLR